MGFAKSACLKFMALFLLLGKLLLQVGAMDFVLGLSRALFGSGRTGPPLMAVMSSTLIGTVSGSAKGNVYDWGNMTILLMRRVGIPRELAEAIETAASSGGQIMPPVMGFVVFLGLSGTRSLTLPNSLRRSAWSLAVSRCRSLHLTGRPFSPTAPRCV